MDNLPISRQLWMMWQNYLMEKTLRLDFLVHCLDPTQVRNKEKKYKFLTQFSMEKKNSWDTLNFIWKYNNKISRSGYQGNWKTKSLKKDILLEHMVLERTNHLDEWRNNWMKFSDLYVRGQIGWYNYLLCP